MYYLAPLVKYFAPNPRTLLMSVLQSYNILCRLFAHVADKEKRNCNAALEL